MTEKLCLQWNDFKANTVSAFARLREDNDFSDVTLVCEDGQQVEAHKVILAASSPVFESLLKKNKHPHPLIYMRGMQSKDLLAIVDFLYRGEANVYQESLDGFLAVAEELQLEGLVGQTDKETMEETNYKPETKRDLQTFDDELFRSRSTIAHHTEKKMGNHSQNKTLALVNSNAGDIEALDEQVNTLMEKDSAKDSSGKALYRCKVCGKETNHGNTMKKHIEANHLEGVSIPCNQCEKTFRSRNAKALHIHRHHEKKSQVI